MQFSTTTFLILIIALLPSVEPNPIQPLDQFRRRLVRLTENNVTTPIPETTPFVPVTTTDLCEELCREGFGGSLCMCNIPPVRSNNDVIYDGDIEAKDEKANQAESTTEIDCEQMCKDGTGGTLCECPPPPFHRIPAEIRPIPSILSHKLSDADCSILCARGIGVGHLCECEPLKDRRKKIETINAEVCSVLCRLPGFPNRRSRCQCHLFV